MMLAKARPAAVRPIIQLARPDYHLPFLYPHELKARTLTEHTIDGIDESTCA